MKSTLASIVMVLLSGVVAADCKVPSQGNTDRIFGKDGRAAAYIEAMQLRPPADVPQQPLNTFLASMKLASVQTEYKHRRVLCAVAMLWHEADSPNPIGARMQGCPDTTTVTEEELSTLYEQVLLEQGLIGPETGKKQAVAGPAEVWILLQR